MSRTFIIGSRGSKLALWQAEHVRERLEAMRPGVAVRIEVIKTSGDIVNDVPLSVIGGQGAFTKEIEHALLDGRVDIAVHSLKDLPTVLPDELTLAAITEREDVRDALVLPASAASATASIDALRAGARVGTSSPRRAAQLKHLRPDIELGDIRGNVDTRLRKLDAGDYDAILLACAGLRRLGLAARISAPLAVSLMLPAVGQGALGIETRADDEETRSLSALLDHAETRAACLAERSLLRHLGGGCQLPIAAHASISNTSMRLQGLVAHPSGARLLRDSIDGPIEDAEQLGERLAARLIERGVLSLLSGDDAATE